MEHRSSRRKRAILKAEIRFDNGMLSAACLVRDVSDTGARLELAGEIIVPDRFDLYIAKRNETRPAFVTWRRGQELGVAFENATPAHDVFSDRLSKLEGEMAELRQLVEKLTTALTGREDREQLLEQKNASLRAEA